MSQTVQSESAARVQGPRMIDTTSSIAAVKDSNSNESVESKEPVAVQE